MYALVIDGEVKKFPYSFDALRQDNPFTSFPNPISDERLADFGVFRVLPRPCPVWDQATQNASQKIPTLEGDKWFETWEISEASSEEISRRHEKKALEVREERNARLSATDWRFRSDLTPSQAWRDYCQALRDLTAQSGFPWSIEWPEQPE